MKSKMMMAALLLPALAWSAPTAETAGTSIVSTCDPPGCLRIVDRNASKTIFSISSDGSVVLGRDVKPDEAAREFWRAVKRMAPIRCANDKTKPK